jgi:uncharacterized protein YlxW (UPF0749 family)
MNKNNESMGLIDLISETFTNIKKETNDWCDFISQREVMKKLNTSHTQLNRYIKQYPNQLKKYKKDRKVFYKKSEINDFINSWVN